MTKRGEVLEFHLESQRLTWVETTNKIAERMGEQVGPSATDIEWLASMVGQLTRQYANYEYLRGRIMELKYGDEK